MARRRRPEISFGSGSFLDVLCNMVGILIILIAVVGMRVADKDDPVVDLSPEETPVAALPDPEVERAQVEAARVARQLEIDNRREEIAARVAARRQAEAAYADEARSRQAEWDRLLAEMRSRNQQLSEEAKKLQQQIQADTALAASDDEKKLKLAGMVAAAVNQNSDLRKNEAELQQQALELMQKRKEVQSEIEAKKVARAIRKPVFQIVARDGNSGTMRRPILIECRADGLQFASEKINISARELSEFTPEYNPLLAGAEALLTYWTLADAQQGETKLKPYVLLIVRPGGTVGFYVARKFLGSINQDHGYELVPEGTEIQWPAADPQAVEVCRRAVDDVLNGPRQTVAARAGGGGRLPGRQGEGGGDPLGAAARYRNKNQIVGSSGDFELPEVEELKRSSPRDAIDMLGPEWSPQRQKLGANRPGTARDQAAASGRLASELQSAREQPREMPGAESAGRSDENGSQNGTGRAADGPTEQRGTGRRLVPAAMSNGAAADATESGLGGTPARNAGGSASGTQASGSEEKENAQTGGAGSANGRSSPLDQRPAGMPGNPLERTEEGMPHDGGRERQWGQGRRGGAIGIEREIVMHLYPDRITIVDGPSAELPDGLGREDFHQIVAAMIQVQANSWGEAPAKFTWRPRLRIQVHPGGNQHYVRLKELLQHWGLSSKVEQVLD